MATSGGSLWNELGVIVALYVALIVGYSIFLYLVYGQAPTADLQALLKEMPSFLTEGKSLNTKINIALILVYVFLLTLPLAVSAFGLSLAICGDSDLNWGSFAAIVVLPFVVYFFVVDRTALYEVFSPCWQSASSATHRDCSPFNVVFYIFAYYFAHYKFPLTVSSAVLGAYAGYKLRNAV